MPTFTERRRCFIEAWVSQPGLVIDRGPDCEPLILPSEITRHGKVYPVRPGDYVYLDRDGNWDACTKEHFEGAYAPDDEPSPARLIASDYTQQRLEALYRRNDQLERAIEVAGAFLERGSGDATLAAIYAPIALDALKAGIVEDFRSSLLCSDDMSDEQLDHWLGQPTGEGHS